MPSLEPQDLSNNEEDDSQEHWKGVAKLCAIMCGDLIRKLYSWDTELDIWHDRNIYATARGTLKSMESAQHVKEDDGKKNFTHILDSGSTKHMTPISPSLNPLPLPDKIPATLLNTG